MGLLEERAALAGKTAVLVGGAGGIGSAASLDLVRCGARVYACDQDEAALDALGAAAAAEGLEDELHLTRLDALEPDAAAAFFGALDADGAAIDVLVNLVGGSTWGEFADTSPADWERDLALNFGHLLPWTQQAVRRMIPRGGGSIVNFTTIEASRGRPRAAIYGAAKAAVENFGRSLAVELAPHGVRVNTVAPDNTRTPAMDRIFASKFGADPQAEAMRRRAARMQIPLGRVGRVEDVSNCVLFLASDLSAYFTGCTFRPDGGTSAAGGWINWPDEGFLPSPPPGALARLFPEATGEE